MSTVLPLIDIKRKQAAHHKKYQRISSEPSVRAHPN